MAKVPPKSKRKMVGVRERAKGIKRLAPVVLQSRNRINRMIDKAVQDPRFASSEAVRQKLYTDISNEYSKLQKGINSYSKSYSTAVARVWRKFAISDLKGRYNQSWGGFSQKYLQDIIKQINPNNIASKVAVKAPTLTAQLNGMLQKDIRFLRESVIEQARLGATEGLTAKEIRKNTQNAVLKQRPGWAFIDAGGKTWKADNYFKMLNKTIYNNASNDTYQGAMAEAGIDLATIEGGPSTVGDSCDRWVGRIVSITGKTDGYPTLDHVKSTSHVFGPNCNHWLGAVLPGELPEAEAQEKETRAKVNTINKYKQEAIDAGVPKSRAHEVVEKAAEKAKVSPFKLSQSQFDKQLKAVA
jgi:hypothetical protein